MKILVVHNAYQIRGGEDAVVQNEIDLLRANGHVVEAWIPSNDSIQGWTGKASAAIGMVFSVPSYFKALALLRRAPPDIVHVHNFFPLVSPSIFFATTRLRIPVVMTLHNYRIVCATSLLMHDGTVTERSLRDGPWWALRHKVYRGSLVGTFFLCLMIWLHKRLGTWSIRVGRFIVLSDFAKVLFVRAGLPVDKLTVKSNFVDMPRPVERRRSGLLFVGRLSPEKGVDVLISAAAAARGTGGFSFESIYVIGDGPLGEKVRTGGLAWLGALPADQVSDRMRSSSALLLPSVWYEGFPMVLVEAFACGLPVIASRLGAMAELVHDGVTGLLFEPGDADDLAKKMLWAVDHPDEMMRMGVAARETYELQYTPKSNYAKLMTIYNDATETVEDVK